MQVRISNLKRLGALVLTYAFLYAFPGNVNAAPAVMPDNSMSMSMQKTTKNGEVNGNLADGSRITLYKGAIQASTKLLQRSQISSQTVLLMNFKLDSVATSRYVKTRKGH